MIAIKSNLNKYYIKSNYIYLLYLSKKKQINYLKFFLISFLFVIEMEDSLIFDFDKDSTFLIDLRKNNHTKILRKKKNPYELSQFNGRVLDLSGERDINNLLMISDACITDYSSVIFEYELLDKPMIYLYPTTETEVNVKF